jgi:hypothetical protein
MKTLTLAHGPITPTDSVTIELIKPDDEQPYVVIHWPGKPTVIIPAASQMWRPWSRDCSQRPPPG